MYSDRLLTNFQKAMHAPPIAVRKRLPRLVTAGIQGTPKRRVSQNTHTETERERERKKTFMNFLD